MVPSSAQASAPKNEITPANAQTPRIAAGDFSSRATRLGTKKIPAPITTPITIENESKKPNFQNNSNFAAMIKTSSPSANIVRQHNQIVHQGQPGLPIAEPK